MQVHDPLISILHMSKISKVQVGGGRSLRCPSCRCRRYSTVGLCLNASKAESRLVMATISLDPSLCSGKDSLRTPSRSRESCRVAQSAARLSRSFTWQGGGPKSSVDDLCTGRGVVLGRAATTLRSIETQPFWLDDLSCQLDKSSGREGFTFWWGARASALVFSLRIWSEGLEPLALALHSFFLSKFFQPAANLALGKFLVPSNLLPIWHLENFLSLVTCCQFGTWKPVVNSARPITWITQLRLFLVLQQHC